MKGMHEEDAAGVKAGCASSCECTRAVVSICFLPGQSPRWYSIGTFNEYNGGFPGPDGMIASQVELWVSNQALAIPVSVVPSLPAPAANWQLLFRQTNGFWFTPGQWSVSPGGTSKERTVLNVEHP